MSTPQPKTYVFASEAKVRAHLAVLGAVNVPGSRSEYSARGGKRVVVRRTDRGFVVQVIPPGCAC